MVFAPTVQPLGHMSRPGPRVVAEVSFCKTSNFAQFKIIYLIQTFQISEKSFLQLASQPRVQNKYLL